MEHLRKPYPKISHTVVIAGVTHASSVAEGVPICQAVRGSDHLGIVTLGISIVNSLAGVKLIKEIDSSIQLSKLPERYEI